MTQDYILALKNHLPDRERATKDAHILVDSHDNDVGNATLAHQVISFHTIRDRIALFNLEG